jgi:hypothetical protein
MCDVRRVYLLVPTQRCIDGQDKVQHRLFVAAERVQARLPEDARAVCEGVRNWRELLKDRRQLRLSLRLLPLHGVIAARRHPSLRNADASSTSRGRRTPCLLLRPSGWLRDEALAVGSGGAEVL